jgi:RimJ/RimL family protein N-acetyltransferase
MLLSAPIETERLRLASLHRDAADGEYLHWLADPEVTRFLEVRFRQHDRDSLAAYIDAVNGSADSLLLGIFRKSDSRHIGNLKAGPIDSHHRRAAIGILIGCRDCWGKGFATEAIREVTALLLGPMALVRVVAGAYAENVASIRAFTNAGFREYAVMKRYWFFEDHWTDQILLTRSRID